MDKGQCHSLLPRIAALLLPGAWVAKCLVPFEQSAKWVFSVQGLFFLSKALLDLFSILNRLLLSASLVSTQPPTAIIKDCFGSLTYKAQSTG
ncbi:hypothetical protein QOT17_012249 [Balamuthia mandrillaris]